MCCSERAGSDHRPGHGAPTCDTFECAHQTRGLFLSSFLDDEEKNSICLEPETPPCHPAGLYSTLTLLFCCVLTMIFTLLHQIFMPFIVVSSSNDTVIQCEMAENREDVFFNFR